MEFGLKNLNQLNLLQNIFLSLIKYSLLNISGTSHKLIVHTKAHIPYIQNPLRKRCISQKNTT